MKTFLISAVMFIALTSEAQDTTDNNTVPAITIKAFAETYYTYDLNKPVDNSRPTFLYSHNRHNEFNANLAFIKAGYAGDRVRANLAIATGTYMHANYAAEPGVLKNIYEANAGYKLSKKRNLWFDIGIMPSHIGFESAISKDCWTLTRSLVAENSPYYETGVKLGYTTNDAKLSLHLLALNGWQRITRVNGNSLMNWGAQLTFKPNRNMTLNYSNFLGTDKPDSARLTRIYHNLYFIFQMTEQFGLTAGFDIGTEQVTKRSHDHHTWYTPVAIFRFTASHRWAIAIRGEFFNDRNNVIVSTPAGNGFQTCGYSLNIDYMPVPALALRIEGRSLYSRDNIFLRNGIAKDNSTSITFSAAMAF